MFVRRIPAGTTDVSVVIRIIDSTDGTPETGVVFDTAGIDLEYRREGAASVDITEATLAALTTAHTDGGFLHIGNGYYRLDLPDAACEAGVSGVLVHGVVTGMVVIGAYIELTNDVTHVGGTVQTAGDLAALVDTVDTVVDDIATQIGVAGAGLTAINLPDQTMNITGNLSGSVGSVTGSVGSVTGGINTGVGTITTLDGLDSAQDSQHAITQDDMLGYAQLICRSDAAIAADRAAELAAINADEGTGAGDYANETESNEAMRDRGDLAWSTATGFSTLDTADVNAEVVDALATDTYAEPSGVPGATISLASKIGYLAMALRNQCTVSADFKTFYDDAGLAQWRKALSDDGTTYTEGEAATP